MDFWGSLLVGILGSILAGVILFLFTALVSRTARWVITATLGRMLRIDTEYVFRNQQDVAEDLKDEIKKAAFVDMLTGRGTELQRDTFSPLFNESKQHSRVRILLPLTCVDSSSYDWTAQRERELAKFDTSHGTGVLQSQIEANAKLIAARAAANSMLQLRFFNAPHIGRIVLTDRCAYFTPYQENAHGRDTHVIKYRCNGDMYNCLRRLFNQLWEASDTSSTMSSTTD